LVLCEPEDEGMLSLDLLVDFFYFGFPVAARAKERQ
jgi:hypothetical protein